MTAGEGGVRIAMGERVGSFAGWFGSEMGRRLHEMMQRVRHSMRKCLKVSLAVALPAILTCCGERMEAVYADANSARRAGAVGGWIPDWLPNSARDIREVHDVDTNQVMIAFSFNPADGPPLVRLCKQVQQKALRAVPFSVRWWPNDVPPSPLVTHRHTYYECPGGVFVAVSVKDGELFYWAP